ncbi:MAG: amidohydrolase family protein [Bacteroidia bacterium]|jgi:dihydroorotase-like cyclic amidohydrolase|nr:amidohydrolase family protein [Bacteroidia bacterium]
MKALLLAFSFCVSLALQAQLVIIRNANIIPIHTDTVLVGQTVVIEKGIIKSIGPVAEIPADAQVINANGMFLTPGLMDMHAHLDNDFPRYDYYRYSMACGVTLMRSMRTIESDREQRDKIEKGELTGPHLWLTAPPVSGDSSWNTAKIFNTVAEAKTKGYTCIKYLGGLDSLQFAQLATIANNAGLRIAGHTPPGGLTQAIATKMASIEHAPALFRLAQADTATQRKIIREMAIAGVAFCPNLHHYNLVYNMYTPYERESMAGLKIVPKNMLAAWDKSLTSTWKYMDSVGFTVDKQKQRMGSFGKLIPLLHREGVVLLCSPDVGEYNVPGYAMAEEMMQFVRYGLTPYQALRTATINPAHVLGEYKRGTVAVGNYADLVLLPENPLKNLRAYQYARYTIVKGKVYSTRKLRKGKYVP